MHLRSSVHYRSLPDSCRWIEYTAVTPFYLALVLKCIKEKCNLDAKYSSICFNHLFNFRPWDLLCNQHVMKCSVWWISFIQSYALSLFVLQQKFTQSWCDFCFNYNSGLYMADSIKPAGKCFKNPLRLDLTSIRKDLSALKKMFNSSNSFIHCWVTFKVLSRSWGFLGVLSSNSKSLAFLPEPLVIMQHSRTDRYIIFPRSGRWWQIESELSCIL